MVDRNRRRMLQAGAAAGTLGTVGSLGLSLEAWAQTGDLVVGAAPPITGVFAFAGVGLNAGLGDYCEWRNTKGGVAGRKLRYVAEDSGYKVDQSVAIFKKIMANNRPAVFYGDSTGWAKAIAPEVSSLGTVMTASPSFSSDLANPQKVPFNFMAGPTYEAMVAILLEYIKRNAKGAEKPTVAFVYSDTEFGRDPIAASKARAEKMGVQVVLEIITKPGAVDVSAEMIRMRRAKPDYVIFHGYVLAPIPEFLRQIREAGLKSVGMGTIWSMDRSTLDAMGAAGDGFLGVMPYRYSTDHVRTQAFTDMEQWGSRKPNNPWQTMFYTHGWLVGMIFAEVMDRTLKEKKELTGANMKAALESIQKWDTGGIFGVPVSMTSHSIPVGRVYKVDVSGRNVLADSEWITIG